MASWSVMTFNLRVMVESDGENAWNKRYPAAARAMEEHGADFIGTQEARLFMLEELAALLPGYAWMGQGRRGGHEDEHCAIFYRTDRWELLESGDFGLSESPDQLGILSWKTDYPRMCTWAKFRSLQDGTETAVFNTHLDHISEEAQVKGMELIRERMEELSRSSAGLPFVLTGDFNVEPDNIVIRGLEAAGYRNAYSILPAGDTDQVPGMTFHDFQGGERGRPIDYIFSSPDLTVEAVQVDRSYYDGRYPSDHYPVCAQLKTIR
ncbi:endonuclease/exonuclease/phosphatase family protein [Gorillibacterium sp. CAU 1737]|uniref:endonuclease/exonuclease/phosphatase family protein n=1 Tax=Gorillibacterium sp. CAU 1737 TaxID=3140362 RepID=UPI0032604D5F